MSRAELSRLSVKPIQIPQGVSLSIADRYVEAKGSKGQNRCLRLKGIGIEQTPEGIQLTIEDQDDADVKKKSGTQYSLIKGLMEGVVNGWRKRLLITGVGYRAQVKGKTLALSLGFSHPVDFPIPEGIVIETPQATEIIISGIDKQKVGQVAANIRRYRPVEPYKGKGVRYDDEIVIRKQAKKK